MNDVHFTPAESAQLRAATSDPVGSLDDVAKELATLRAVAAGATRELDQATRRFARDQQLHGAHVPEQAAEEARREALKPLEAAERDLRKRLKLASARAEHITKAIDAAAATSVASLEGDALHASAARRAFLAAEIPAQPLERAVQRVRSALLRGDQVELYALISVLDAILPARDASPRLGDTRAGLDAARKALRDARDVFRDTTLDAPLERARGTVHALQDANRAIDREMTNRGADPYGFVALLANPSPPAAAVPGRVFRKTE